MNAENPIPRSEKAVQNRIPALDKALEIMHYIAGAGCGLPTKAITMHVGVSASTGYRILKTLESAGWIAPDEQGGFRVGQGLLPLLEPLSGPRRIAQLAQPMLERLAHEFGVTVKLTSPQGHDQVTIAVGSPAISIGILSPVGIPYPIVEAATGAALLSSLSDAALEAFIVKTPPAYWRRHQPDELRGRVRQCQAQGWCQNIGTHVQGIDAIACPVQMGADVLALGMIGLRGDFTEEALPSFVAALLDAKRTLEQAI